MYSRECRLREVPDGLNISGPANPQVHCNHVLSRVPAADAELPRPHRDALQSRPFRAGRVPARHPDRQRRDADRPGPASGIGDVLHEAGHIVIVPFRWRSMLGNDVIESLDEVVATDPDAKDDELQTSIKMSEFMAQAWSYAALKDLGLPPECVFFPGSYKYHPEIKPHPMATWVESGTHFGIMALSQVGMTGGLGLFEPPGANGLEPFPKMAKWLQD